MNAIKEFLQHATEARARMNADQPANAYGRTAADGQIDGGASPLKLVCRCPSCGGQGYRESIGRPSTRTACIDCGATGKFPTSIGVAILQLLDHVHAPVRTADAQPAALEKFNSEARRQNEERQAVEREQEAKRQRAERARDLLAEADPDVLARVLQTAGARLDADRQAAADPKPARK